MKNFLKIAQGVDVLPLLMSIHGKPDLWDENTLRTAHPGTAHAAVSDIWLLFNELSVGDDPAKVYDDRHVVAYRGWRELPEARELALDLMRRVKGIRLGRVIITKLPPGRAITPHVDGGAPAEYYTRFQIALKSLPGCSFIIEDEQVQFQTGDVWMIDNKKEHAVQNNSADDRIAMVVDVRIE